MPNLRILIVALLLLRSLSVPVFAAELKGVKFPEQQTVEGKTLELNGLGLRQATFLKVNVYVAALYVAQKTKDAAAILDSPAPKRISLSFMRDVDVGKIRGAWKEGFEDNCKPNCDTLRPGLERINATMTDLKKGDLVSFTVTGARVLVDLNGTRRGEIDMAGLGRVLLSIWLGEKPPGEDLKRGLLGVSG